MTAATNQELFLSVLEAHKGIIYKVANTYCKDAEDRKDVVQEIIIQLWKAFPGYNAAFRHSTFIYRIALNVAISFYRKETSRKKIAHPFSSIIYSMSDTGEKETAAEGVLFLQRFISELKPLDKALMLLYLEEKNHREIAEIIGITETNVATKIGRIKQALKQKFAHLTL